jgi:hypothetical protein
MSMNITIFTSMTDPEKRMDPWKEAISCYQDLADEVIIVGEDWPHDFSWDHIGKTFHEGFEKSNGDWVIRMDLDYFFHEKSLKKIYSAMKKYEDQPALAFPQYQIFTPDRYQVKTKLCIALNKKKYPNIILNGGGDLTHPTLNNIQIKNTDVPFINTPIWQYDSSFRTREIISHDRARFARAWYEYFNEWGDRGGGSPDAAFDAWFQMIQTRYKKHVNKLKISDHPKYIKEKLLDLDKNQFGFDAFGLKLTTKRDAFDYLISYKNRIIDNYL